MSRGTYNRILAALDRGEIGVEEAHRRMKAETQAKTDWLDRILLLLA